MVLYFLNGLRFGDVTMRIRLARFNIILLATLLSLALAGCQSAEKKYQKQIGSLRVHLEVNPDISTLSNPVPIYRESPVMINVEKSPFLTEADVEEARVVPRLAGFAIFIKFTRRGAWLLENYSASNSGRRFAVFVQYGPNGEHSRWLAAPKTNGRITDGTLSFTPDASYEEAEEIVLSLNNAARKSGNLPKQSE